MSETRVTSETGGQKGQKHARFDLIPVPFLWCLSNVFGFGCLKYDDDNWRKGYSWKLSYGALHRHLALFWMGEWKDDESKLPHVVHAAWHCCILFMFAICPRLYQKFDDRQPVDPVLIAEFKAYTPNYEEQIRDAVKEDADGER